jgi:hypothetical protein
MLANTELLPALLPALLAGGMAIAATLAVERWGGVVGGVLGSLPTTIVPAALGLYAANRGIEAFHDALHVTPVGMLLNVGFLYLWRVLPDRLPQGSLAKRLALMLFLSLSAWAVMAFLGVSLVEVASREGIRPFWLGLGATVLTLGAGLAATWTPRPAPKGKRKVSVPVVLARGLLTAAAIGTSVLIARSAPEQGVGSLVAGIAAVFPAIFMTTMAGLWLSQGAAVPSGAVGPMMLGSCSVSTFSLLAAWLMPELGAGPGASLSWVLSISLVSLPVALWLRRGQASLAA